MISPWSLLLRRENFLKVFETLGIFEVSYTRNAPSGDLLHFLLLGYVRNKLKAQYSRWGRNIVELRGIKRYGSSIPLDFASAASIWVVELSEQVSQDLLHDVHEEWGLECHWGSQRLEQDRPSPPPQMDISTLCCIKKHTISVSPLGCSV